MRLRLKKINESRTAVICCLCVVFLIMLLLNILTVMVMDDYLYSFSFETHERITNVLQIFPSMYRHYMMMNGRLLLHFLVQLVLMAPAIIFDILNTLMFCALVALIYYYCCYRFEGRHNALLLILIVALLWIFTPAFGQVFLWLDGSVNYLWPAVFVLLYLLPLTNVLDGRMGLNVRWKRILWVLAGFPIGALSESFSMAVMAAIFLIFVYRKFIKKEKTGVWTIMALPCCMVGYLAMMVSPGTWSSKVDGKQGLAATFLNVLDQYTQELKWLIVLWIVLIISAIYLKFSRRAILYSCLFMALSVIVNFLHIAANRYPVRSMTAVTIFLIMADMYLLTSFWGGRYEGIVCIVSALSLYYAVVAFFPGGYDILTVYRECRARENYIIEERNKGNMDLEVQLVECDTKYSSLYTWKYLKTGTWDDWRNVYMAWYYGVNTITGVK